MTQNLMSSLLLFDFSPHIEACITHLKGLLKKKKEHERNKGGKSRWLLKPGAAELGRFLSESESLTLKLVGDNAFVD